MQDLDKFKNDMELSGKNVYVGNRYGPVLDDTGWDNTKEYEPLTIVQHEGDSYVSRGWIPKGVDILNKEYWYSIGVYNAQIASYRKRVEEVEDNINSVKDNITQNTNTITEHGDKIQVNTDDITNLKDDVTDHDTKINNLVDFTNNEPINIKFPPAPLLAAKGDGVTDDTKAIQAILDLKTSVFIPKGDYLVTDTLYYYTKQEIYGVGDMSLIKSTITGKPVMKNSEQFFNTNFHDFKIEGTGTERNGIEMKNGYEHFYISRVSIVSVGGNGLHLENIYGLHANGLHIIGLGLTEKGIYGYGINGCKFSDMLVKSNLDSGIHFNWTYKNSVKDSIIEANHGHGIYSISGQSLTLRDLYFEGNGATNGETKYDIFIDDENDSTNPRNVHNRLNISDNYFFSRYTKSTVKVSSPVNKGIIQNNYILEGTGKLEYQTYRYDLDIRNNGYLTVKDIEENSRTLNGQANIITVIDKDILNSDDYAGKTRLVYSTDGKTITGDVPCTINTRVARMENMTLFNFEITNINAASLADNLTVYIIPPIERSSRVGHFTAPIDFIGSSSEVTGVYTYMGSGIVGDLAKSIILKKIGTSTDISTRFDTSNFKDGITSLRGSILYY